MSIPPKVEQSAHQSTVQISAGFGVWDWDILRDQVNFSKGWCLMMGFKNELKIQPSIEEWKSLLLPDEKQRVLADLQKVLSGQSLSMQCTHSILCGDGVYKRFQTLGEVTRRDKDGKPTHFAAAQFPSSVGRNQDTHAAAMVAAKMGSWSYSVDTRLFHVSEEYLTMIDPHRKKLGEWVGTLKQFTDRFMPEGSSQILSDAIEQAVNTGEPDYRHQFEHPILFSDASNGFVKVLLTLRRDGNGSPMRIVGVSQDVTDDHFRLEILRKQRMEMQNLVEKLKEQTAKAEAANKAKSIFLATMSHEIRTPMNAVIGMASLLMDSDLTDEQRTYTETITSGGNTLLHLIDEILDLSKIESNMMTLESEPFKVWDLILESLEIVRQRAVQKNIEISYEIDWDVPTTLVGDATRIKQIILNLLSNAVKFTESGGMVSLSLSCRRQKNHKIYLQCSVSDTGIGLSKEARKNIFQPFVQADDSITRRFGGSGLGLAISQKLVKLMKGNLHCDSQEGKGSTFSFDLALSEYTDCNSDFLETSAGIFTGMKVMIVDDNPVNQRMLGSLARNWGMLVRGARSTEQALSLLNEVHPDVIISSQQLDERSGEDLTTALKNAHPDHPPLILCAMHPSKEPTDNGQTSHPVVFKPVPPTRLFSALKECLSADSKSRESGETLAAKKMIESRISKQYPLNILIAEDNPVNQRVIGLILGKMGYAIKFAKNGLEALDAAREGSLDLILMDIEMPELDGLSAFIRIRDELPADLLPHVIALSANASPEKKQECLKEGMYAYLIKPILIPELIEQIKKVHSERSA